MERVKFKINNAEYSVGCEISSDVMLLDYLREHLELRGTKYLCRQAGCGACIVTAQRPPGLPYAVNSCILPITACQGLEITTIEGVGNRKKGYHPVQTTLAEYNGSQCGYCSPGWVMAMYSLLESKKDLTMLEIEKSFASNVCRCTGYRPILDAFKSFAKDAPLPNQIPDIEDLRVCNRDEKFCIQACEDDDWCIISMKDLKLDDGIIKINLKDGKTWYKVNKVADIFRVLRTEGYDSYKLICGNTAKGVYPEDEMIDNCRVLIGISEVQDLVGYVLDQNLVIRAGTTLTNMLSILKKVSEMEYFNYLKTLYDHITLVAHLAVRNVGSIAGNLMIKHRHNEFQSDIFLLFETVGAQLTIVNSSGAMTVVTMQQFLKLDMNAHVIINVMLPPLNKQHKVITFKVMPRSQNAHAIVNSGFVFKLTPDNIVIGARIVFGGLSASFNRATATEQFLVGKPLFKNATLQAAVNILEAELVVTENPPEPSVVYRRKVALGLFYKGLLTICPDSILNTRFKSGTIRLHESRPVSNGRQVFDTDSSTWPLNEPLPKIEGLIQCAGEAMYTDDIPTFLNEVHAAFVLTTIAKGRIVSIDPSDALKYPGVIAFYSAKDIPGLNSFTPADSSFFLINEEVFCSGQVKYYNQPLGLVVADTQEIANKAVNLVKVKYTNIERPVIDMRETRKNPKRNTLYKEIKATKRGEDVAKVIKGNIYIKGQTHFSIETLVSLTKSTEEGLTVYATAQWPTLTQIMVSRALKLEQNRIDVHIRRIGGSYGMKLTRSILTSVASSLVAMKLNRPCRIINRMETNTKALGKRFPCFTDFEVGVNKSGIIQYMNYNLYEDNGYSVNEDLPQFGIEVYNNCYNAATWNYKCINTVTDTAKNSWFRAPGTLENIAMTELMMEQISYELSVDPVELRLANIDPQHDDLREMYETLKTSSDYTIRRSTTNKFNAENRWKKRGLRFVFLRWKSVQARYFDVNLAVYEADGTVAISHGGVEIGQGINTKATQIAAYMLKIPIEKIIIKEYNTIVSPNASGTGGSLTTQNIILAVEKCCEQLLARLEPIRKILNNPSWEELIAKSAELFIDLQVHGFVGANDIQDYQIYGVTLAEVEIDVLTGEAEILRVDVLHDVGRSINPELDIGQVEGAFIMGVGYWTTENLVYDSQTGELLTDRTWNYYVPQARDIPQDFRVYLRKKSYSTKPIFGSKACSEPPICMSVAVPIAIREAIVCARQEAGLPSTTWYNIVGCEISSNVMLLDYLREHLELRGTKYMCRQAGCGACIVTAQRPPGLPYAVNSCILPITACQGLEITTIEGVGNRKNGYHPVQTALAKYNGSQCGYCSPGWVMAMYSLLQSKKDLTKLEIEQSFASNICRCTGYRPILDAFKSFAIDAPKPNQIPDIEDLKICKRGEKSCIQDCEDGDWCIVSMKDFKLDNGIIKIDLDDGKTWYQVNKIADIFSVVRAEGYDSYKLICGNTAKGVYPEDEMIDNPRVLIGISEVQDLVGYVLDQNLIIRAGTTLTNMLSILKSVSEMEYFSYLKILYDHITLVAHLAVRNVGSIAGNLMIKHRHNEFQSDIFLLFETVGAQLTIVNSSGATTIVTMQQFLKLNMKAQVIVNVMLPPLNNQHKVITFKVMPRSQNAHAIVNSGFLYELTPNNVVIGARIVFGGLSASFNRATATERFLVGKPLFTNSTLQAAVNILEAELVVTENPPEPSVTYRRKVALGLFYKGLLTLCPDSILNPRYKSGTIRLHKSRPVSHGRQVFDTDPSTWPLNEPILKIEGLIQCAGEAMYTDDIPTFPNEVHAAFVLTTVSKGRISSIDASDALNYPGVIAFYAAKDIPGLNSFTPADNPIYQMNEEVFCSGQVKYYNQPLGVVVAETQAIADKAVYLVKIEYKNIERPVIDIRDARKDPKRNTLYKEFKATKRGQEVAKVIRGQNYIKGQYHFSIETLVSVTKSTEEGLIVYATAQWPAATQIMISRALKLEQNRIDVHIRRIGDSYGIKISRSILTSVASSLVAMKLNRPCRIIHRMETNTKALGKRLPCFTDFEAGVNKSGVFQYVNYNLYEDNGYSINEDLSLLGVEVYNNCYNAATWNYKCINTLTDTAKNTWFRAPGTLENIAMTEFMMEQISYELAVDPVELRLANLDPQHDDLREMYETLKTSSDYTTRRIATNKFNAENRWKKRGLRFVFLRWKSIYPRYFDVNLAVYRADGTVAISHGGVEIGQGINTKATQIAAYLLNIPREKVIIKENNTIVTPNAAVTGGNLTTQNIILAVEKCCEQLLARLEPIRKKLNNPSWEESIEKSFEMYVDLQAHGFVDDSDIQDYQIYGVTLAEVEIDVLTGETEILRVDVLHDVGRSINPELDVGQVEGAFIMGLGYWTIENLVYDSQTGELLTDRTWNYYVPQARDIPQDFRVYLRKKSYSTKPIFGSKACSEPPICMSVAVPIAIREAIVCARQEAGLPSTTWYNIDGPYTTDQICLACETRTEEFKYN